MSEKVTCGSLAGGRCVFSFVVEMPDLATWETHDMILALSTDGPDCAFYCPACGARLSFDADGKPVAEAMVPRAALEVALQQMAVVEVTCDVGPATDFPLTPDELAQEVADYVATAEEARDGETSG